MAKKKINNLLRPKDRTELLKTAQKLKRDQYVMAPILKNGCINSPSEVAMLSSILGEDSGNRIISEMTQSVSMEMKMGTNNSGTKDLGFMTWGASNNLPNTITALTEGQPYTATGWKFNTDVTAGLGPVPKYRYVLYTPGIGLDVKEIDYEAAGDLIRGRILELRQKQLDIATSVPVMGEEEENMPSASALLHKANAGSRYADSILKSLEEHIAELEADLKEWERTNAEVIEFRKNTDLNHLLLNMSGDMNMMGICFTEIQLSNDGSVKDTNNWKPKVTRLGFYPNHICRLEKKDADGVSRYVYISNRWLQGDVRDNEIEALPALDPMRPGADLTEKIRQARLDNLSADQRPTRFILPTVYNTPGHPYYPRPAWHSIFDGSIYDYASTIISDRATRRKNSNIIGRVIYIHSEYMDKLYLQSKAQTAEDRQRIFNEVMGEILAFLRDPNKSGQSLFAQTFTGNDGKEHDSYKIVEIPAANKGTAEANKTELQEVTGILFFAQGISPDLIGAIPGHSGSSGGTYQREMLCIKQLLLSPTQKILLAPFEVASYINEWDSHLVWRIQQMSLTTLDRSKTGLTENEIK